jgi:2-C-methyl-D-erythritol 2,4-cyclodiphosphate synthase
MRVRSTHICVLANPVETWPARYEGIALQPSSNNSHHWILDRDWLRAYDEASIGVSLMTTRTSRCGIAYDLHRLVAGRKFILGGVELEFEKGPAGHSDGDVLSHAICDALLGAGGLGDIGTHFPDTDAKWKGASSLVFLEHTRKLLDERGSRITHIDAVVITEKPKLTPHFAGMRAVLARALGIDASQINLKAKTNEGVDAIGRGEAIAAHAVATIES